MLATHVEIVTFAWLKSHGLRVLIFIALAFGLSLAARAAVRRLRRKVEAAETMTGEDTLTRTITLTSVVTSAIRIIVSTFVLLLTLGELGVNLAPLIAGAGIAGVALGFGAQSLVRDFLAGFFILLENQFTVRNTVEVRAAGTAVTGTIESLTLRTTKIRTFDGTLVVIPNGMIEMIGNKSRGWARAIVDVRVPRGSEVEEIRALLDGLLDEMDGEDGLKGAFSSRPTLLGVETVGSHEIVFRVVVETRPSRRFDIERELRRRIEARLEQHGVKAPPIMLPSQG